MLKLNKKIFVITLAAFLNTSCTESQKNRAEVLLPKKCAIDAIDNLNLRSGNYTFEYIPFSANTPINKVFPGYLRIESSINSKELLDAVANRLASICMPEETVEYSQNVTEEMIGSAVSEFVGKPENKLIIVTRNDTYKIIGHKLQAR